LLPAGRGDDRRLAVIALTGGGARRHQDRTRANDTAAPRPRASRIALAWPYSYAALKTQVVVLRNEMRRLAKRSGNFTPRNNLTRQPTTTH
jgi:hypothetical protein